MTLKETLKNLENWIFLLYKKSPLVEDHSSLFILHYPEFSIYSDKYNYTVLAMGWYYDFKEAEDVINFIEEWRLL